MIDFNRHYTAAEKRSLEAQGYEFTEVSNAPEDQMTYIITGPELPRGLAPDNGPDWMNTADRGKP